METKLKSHRRAHKGVVTKLLKKFEDFRQNSNVIPEEVSTLLETLTEKRTILADLNSQILDITSEEDVAEELDETDEYMFALDTKLKQITNYKSSLQSSTQSSSTTQSVALNPMADNFTPSNPENTTTCTANETSASEKQVAASCVSEPISNHAMSQPAFSMSQPAFAMSQPAFSMSQPALAMSQPAYAISQPAHSMHDKTHMGDASYLSLPQDHTQSTSNMLNSQMSSISHASSQNHRLPKLDLPTFDGNILNWQTFWDAFNSTIHLNTTLTEIQKFSYLKAQLRSTASESIEGFPLTGANYATAVDLLKERFGQPHKVIHAYMKALMDLPAPTNELSSLRSYSDKLEAYVRGLDSLGQTQSMYGALLVPVVLEKLPVDIMRQIARENGTDDITLIDLRKAILKELSILEVGRSKEMIEPKSTVTF